MGYESLLDHYNDNEWRYNLRMFYLGFSNNLGFGIMISFAAVLALKYDYPLHFGSFYILIKAVPIVARFIAASWLITFHHTFRMTAVCIIFELSWVIFLIAYLSFRDNGE